MRKNYSFLFSVFLLLATCGPRISAATSFAGPEAAVAPTITSQPKSESVKVGAQATFTVTASGTTPLSYQWYKYGSQIAGATSSKYTTPATTDQDNGANFYVTVSNSAGTIESSNAYLTVGDPPAIAEQPTNETVTAPGVATFSAYATGTQPITCQWSKNGHAIAGATDCYSPYTTEETTTADNGALFTFAASNAYGKATSNAAVLTVKASATTGTYPIVGTWSGSATITDPVNGNTTSQVAVAFSQTAYALIGTVVYTDDNGIPTESAGIASLNGQNVYIVEGGDPSVGIAGAFSTNLLTLTATAEGDDGSSGSGTLTLSTDHQTLTGTGTYNDGTGTIATIAWKLTRDK